MSNNTSYFLKLRIKVKNKCKKKLKRFSLHLPPIAIYQLYLTLLSFDGIAAVLPSKVKSFSDPGLYAAQSFMLALMHSKPDEYANIDIQSNDCDVKINLKTY